MYRTLMSLIAKPLVLDNDKDAVENDAILQFEDEDYE